jgi:hypothetical protein
MYVPMSEDEQEVIQRLIETDDLEVVAHEWGVLNEPNIIAGDHRIGIRFRLDFLGSPIIRHLHYLDLELRTRAGMTIFRETKAISPPILIDGSTFVDWQWDIALHSMSPELVRIIKPGAKGLTSRRQDRDTGEMTAQGNMSLDTTKKRLLAMMEQGNDNIRKEDEAALAKVLPTPKR